MLLLLLRVGLQGTSQEIGAPEVWGRKSDPAGLAGFLIARESSA